MRHGKTLLFSLYATMLFSNAAMAEDYVLSIRNHQFIPADITVPADKKVKLVIKNTDPTPAEFESTDLNREKIIGASSEGVVFIGPLDPGTYHYFDDFHRDATTGTITVK